MNTPQDLYDVLKKYGCSSVNEQRDDGWTPLMNAVLVSDKRSAKTLIENGARLELREEEGRTALYIAVEYGVTDMTRMLIDAGADINAKNKDGYTPLQCAKFCEDLFAGSDTGKFYTSIREMIEAKAAEPTPERKAIMPPPERKAIMPPPRKKPPSKRFSL
jgi:ankyrin repeat protein